MRRFRFLGREFDVIRVLFVIISIMWSEETEGFYQQLKHNVTSQMVAWRHHFEAAKQCVYQQRSCSILSAPQSPSPIHPGQVWAVEAEGGGTPGPPIKDCKVVVLQRTRARDVKTVATTLHFSWRETGGDLRNVEKREEIAFKIAVKS